jgi:poly(ADP-ribose) glycohydrolase
MASSVPSLPPPSPALTAALSAAAQAPPRDLDELAGLLERLGGARPSLAALAALLRDEPGFEPRLFGRVLPALLRYAAVPRGELPLLAASRPGRLVLPREAVAGLVAHMFLGALPPPRDPLMPLVSFDRLLSTSFAHEHAKLRCVLAYFDRIAEGAPPGEITIERDMLAPPRDAADWAADRSPLGPFEVVPEGGVEDSAGAVQIDFANRFLGGGVLTGGCVQEEIRFSVCPELLAALPFCPAMRDHEAIRLHGAERFASVGGYAFGLRFAGDFHDPSPRRPDGTPDVTLVAIDALDLRREAGPGAQYRPDKLLREANKAFVGFGGTRPAQPATVATGHWGCGVFLGDHALKAVLQWAAASAAGVALRYHTYGDGRAGDLEGFTSAARLRLGTVGALWARLSSVAPQGLAGATAPWLFNALLADER